MDKGPRSKIVFLRRWLTKSTQLQTAFQLKLKYPAPSGGPVCLDVQRDHGQHSLCELDWRESSYCVGACSVGDAPRSIRWQARALAFYHSVPVQGEEARSCGLLND